MVVSLLLVGLLVAWCWLVADEGAYGAREVRFTTLCLFRVAFMAMRGSWLVLRLTGRYGFRAGRLLVREWKAVRAR